MNSRKLGRTLRLWIVLAVAGCDLGGGEPDAVREVGTQVGHAPPDLEGVLPSGETYSLDADDDSPVVVVFFQGAYCGLCREQLAQLQQHFAAYQRLDARVVAVTSDPPPVTGSLSGQLGLHFPVVSAEPGTLIGWGVLQHEDSLARPGSFVVRDGRIVFRHVGRNAADRTSDARLLALLEELKGE